MRCIRYSFWDGYISYVSFPHSVHLSVCRGFPTFVLFQTAPLWCREVSIHSFKHPSVPEHWFFHGSDAGASSLSIPGTRNVPNTEVRNAFRERSEHVMQSPPRAAAVR